MVQKLPTYADAQKAICGGKDPKAFLNLGILYAQGIGTEQNDMLASYFIKKAIDMGCKEAEEYIKSEYESGKKDFAQEIITAFEDEHPITQENTAKLRVCRSENIIEHQRAGDGIRQCLIVMLHLLGCQGIIGRQCGYNHIGSRLRVGLCLCQLLTEAVARQSRIDSDTSTGSLRSRLYEKQSVFTAHAVTFARRSHQQWRHLCQGEKPDNSLNSAYVKAAFWRHGCHHRHHHATILFLVH